MSVLGVYLWAFVIVAAFIGVGAFFVRRAYTLNRNPSRPTLPPRERMERALIDMRLRGIATPEELSAQTEAAQEIAAPPPDLPGLPQTPADARKETGSHRRRHNRRRPREET